MSTGIFKDVNGERVEMTEEEVAAMEAQAPVEAAAAPPLTVRVFRARFADTEADINLYDELDARMEAERSRLVKQQWRDPGAEIVEGAALYNAIATHLDALLVTPERKAELLA